MPPGVPAETLKRRAAELLEANPPAPRRAEGRAVAKAMQMFRPVGKLAGFGTIAARPPIVPAAAEVSDVTSFFLGSLRLHWPWPHTGTSPRPRREDRRSSSSPRPPVTGPRRSRRPYSPRSTQLLSADFRTGGSGQRSGDFVADGASAPPGDGGGGGEVRFTEDG